MSKRVRELRDLVIDEISLVDKGANQHATVTIAKRHGEEDRDMEYYDEGGNLVDTTSLEVGDVVFDADGQAYEFVEETDEQVEEEREPELVGKAFRREEPKETGSLAEELRTELSKALTDSDRDAVISKALGRVEEIAKRAEAAEAKAESERQLRLEREYTEIAKSYNAPVAPEELGRVLMKLGEVLDHDEQVVIRKCLEAIPDGMFDEVGYRGGGSNNDVIAQIEQLVGETVSKAAGDISEAEALASVFEANPDLYDQYNAERF